MQPERVQAPKVLLVEDDDIDAMAIERSFRRESVHLELVRAKSAEQAIELMREQAQGTGQSPCVALLDLNMPGMGGHGFLDSIREDDALKSLVVFVLSTSSAPRDIELAYQRQVAGFFVKAIETGSNLDVVEALKSYFAASWLPGDE